MAKKAGQHINCPRCHGAGYVMGGLTNDVPYECSRCNGTGIVQIQKAAR